MRLKSFTANSMKDAMQMIRDTLGENAIIVATREENGGKTVRVTAAIDKDTEATMPRPLQEIQQDEWMMDQGFDVTTAAEEVTDILIRHSVPDEVMENIIAAVSMMNVDDPLAALSGALQNLFEFKPLPTKTYGKPLILVGPPGAGKTLAAAKIAARGALSGSKVAVITTDTVRAGGVEQLEAFTRLMKIDLKKASTPQDVKARLSEIKNADQIIIDTAGVNPFDPESVKLLARIIGVADMDPVLVLPAGMDADESGDVARVFAMVGARSLLPTRVDVTRRLGSLLSAAQLGGLSFTEVSNTAKVADGLSPLSARRLTQLLMPRAIAATMTNAARKAG
jgi:flagellar biosynthesis protein FlhF